MLEEISEFRIDLCLFPVRTIVKSDLLTVINQIVVFSTVLYFKLLFDGSELSEGRRNKADYYAG